MKKVLFTLVLMNLFSGAFAQFIATVEMKESVEGICDNKHVYALFSGFRGQEVPKCSYSKEEIKKLLNDKVKFIKENPKFKGKGMVGVYINCKGQALNWETDTKTKNEELDQQILDVLKTLIVWTPGKLEGNDVDTRELISYSIKKGIIDVE